MKKIPIEVRLTPSDLHDIFDLQPDGRLIWRRRVGNTTGDKIFNAQFPGKEAGGTKGSRPYVQVRLSFDGVLYLVRAHRIVIAMADGAWPSTELSIDHIDGNVTNNTRSNLRICSHISNMKNQKRPSNSTSGFKGVGWHKAARAWTAKIGVNNKRIHLGCFDSSEDAARAYDYAALKYHGDFARTNASMGLIAA